MFIIYLFNNQFRLVDWIIFLGKILCGCPLAAIFIKKQLNIMDQTIDSLRIILDGLKTEASTLGRSEKARLMRISITEIEKGIIVLERANVTD